MVRLEKLMSATIDFRDSDYDLIYFSEHGMRFVILFIMTLGGFFMQRKYRKHKYHNDD